MARQPLPAAVIDLGNGFWNIRGALKIGGVVDVGTQASLVRLASGNFVLLDACHFTEPIRRWVDSMTHAGEKLSAMLHLHPFHTLYVRRTHEMYPQAKLYGTRRHHERLADLPWEQARTETSELHALFDNEFRFSIPRGVEFISSNENVHFSSVIALHRASKTMHVDDTLIYLKLPRLVRRLKRDVLRFHPTLAKALAPYPGAAHEFRQWAEELIDLSRDADNLCAAHTAALLNAGASGGPISRRVARALQKVEPTLRAHEGKR